jgi:predicted helicase
MVEQLGIVYTPVECVDFIIHSVNDILKKEFGRSLTDENVHILDPFTGTGTFITRLFQSGLIKEEDLRRKYKHEIHANEIVLLAYYIAAVKSKMLFDATLNIDDGGEMFLTMVCLRYVQLGESDDSEKMFSNVPKTLRRVQDKAPLRVIKSRIPLVKKSANDNAQNQSYQFLTTYFKYLCKKEMQIKLSL